MTLLYIFTGLFCGFWVLIFSRLMWTLKRIPFFHNEVNKIEHELTHWPKISVIIPACNEAEHIEEALSSVLALNYPAIEFIVINDRSTDTTGEILNRMAASDTRIQPVHIDSLPARWLGKVHALHLGVQQASGDWFLFTDADIRFEPDALKHAMQYVAHHEVDHLALLPRVILHNFWIEVAIRTFGLLFLLSTRADQVNRPGSQTPMGIGAFNLVRAETFHQSPGFEWLRMEPGDDYGLGVMIKKAGGRTHFALADECLAVPWYASVKEMFKGLEKNLFGPGAHYRWWRMLFMVAGLWVLVAAPATALVTGLVYDSKLLLLFACLPIVFHLFFSVFFIREKRSETISLLFFPVGILLFSCMLLWSGYRCLKNGGIDWRGTHYSLDELREGQRIKF